MNLLIRDFFDEIHWSEAPLAQSLNDVEVFEIDWMLTYRIPHILDLNLFLFKRGCALQTIVSVHCFIDCFVCVTIALKCIVIKNVWLSYPPLLNLLKNFYRVLFPAFFLSSMYFSSYSSKYYIYSFYRNDNASYRSDSLVLCNISRLLFEVVRDWGVRVTGLSQVLDYLKVLRGHSKVQRRVALVILDVNENFFRLGQNLDDFKWTELTCDMQRRFTLLGPGIDIGKLFNQ